MSKKIRHIWAKANQHVKVHRNRHNRPASNSADGDNTHYIIIGVIVVLYLLLK